MKHSYVMRGVRLLATIAGSGLVCSHLIGALLASHDQVPPLLQDLPHDLAHAKVEFERRVNARFHIGSKESVLIAELKRQGWAAPVFEREYTHAVLKRSGMSFVQHVAVVSWTVDGRGRLTSVQGIYGFRAP